MRKRVGTLSGLQRRRDHDIPAAEHVETSTNNPLPALAITPEERALFAALFAPLIDQILAEPDE